MNQRKRIPFIVLWVALCLPIAVGAQTGSVITIGDTSYHYGYGWNIPCNSFGDSYTQQLILANELGGETMITGIDLYCTQSPSATGRGDNCTVYLARTFVEDMWGGLLPFGPMFEQVMVDSLVCDTGWNHYAFDTPFHYYGFENLILAVDAPTGVGGIFAVEHISGRAYYTRMRLAAMTSTITGWNVGTYRNLMRLHTEPVDDVNTKCPPPTVWADSIGSDAVRLVWSTGGSDTAWVVEAMTDGDTVWRSSGVLNDTTYTMAGLSLGTDYIFRVTAFCTDTFVHVIKHIVTACQSDSIPYFEGLVGLTDVPTCWQTTVGMSGGVPPLVIKCPTVVSGERYRTSKSVRLNGESVTLPIFNVPIDSLDLYFWAKSCHPDSSVDLYVGVVTDPLDVATFVPFDTVAVTHEMEWIPVTVRFEGYNRPFGRIAIVSADTSKPYIYIDDIEVCRSTPCRALPMMSVDWVTDTSAMVHWTDTSGALYYDVAYGLTEDGLDSAQIITHVSGDSLLLMGLSPYTQYDVYVRPECGTYTVHWSPVRTFRTLCIALVDSVPYIEDFEAYDVNSNYRDITCWQSMQGELIGVGRGSTLLPAHSGNCRMGWDWRRSWEGMEFQRVIFPPIDTVVLPINTLKLSFWAENVLYPRAYGDAVLVVGVMDDPDVDTSFVPVDTVYVDGVDWMRYDVPLDSYSGSGRFITLKSCPVTAGNWLAYLDDITIDLITPCPNVSGMHVTGLSSNSVTVAWKSRDTATVWQTYIDTVSTATPQEDSVLLTVPSCTFDSLETGRSYYVWVRALCARGDTSEWEGPMQVVPGVWDMRADHNDTMVLCGVSLYDDGGDSGAFISQTSTLVIMPDVAGSLVSVSGVCDVGGSSTFTIYDGVGTAGPILWYKGINNSEVCYFGPITSSAGPLTIAFRGIAYGTPRSGFDIQVSCEPDHCIIHHLQLDPLVTATDSTLALTWECNDALYYEVEYGPVGFVSGTGTLDTTSSNSYVITGLASFDRREVYVRSICGVGDTGEWVRDIFTTQSCDDAVYRVNYDSTMLSGSHNAMPVGINVRPYSYVQTLVDSAHLAGLESGITALAFRPASFIEGNHMNNITVYLANVADTDMSAGPILPDAGHRFVKVIDSANLCHTATTDWQMVSFDRPFMWDGHKSLLVAVLREDGGSSAQVTYACHYRYADYANSINRSYVIMGYTPIDIDSADIYQNSYLHLYYADYHVGDMRLYTNTCDQPLCAMPVVDSVTGDYESVTIAWSGTSDEYQIAIDRCRPATLYPASEPVSVNGNQYTFTGLQPSTIYAISLRQSCMADSLGYSDWVTVYFTTDSFVCPETAVLTIDSVTYSSATFDWYDGLSCDTLWQLEVWAPGSRHVCCTPTEHPFTIEGLAHGTEYCAYVHGYCGSECQIAGKWSDTLCFSTLGCPDVTEFDTAAVSTTVVVLTWYAEPMAHEYILEYGPAGFELGTGTEQRVVFDNVTVTGLTPATAYDFYLRTVCDSDWYSDQYATLLNVVTRQRVGIAETDAQFQFSLMPNPAKGVTTVQIVGLPAKFTGLLHVTVSDLSGRDVLVRDIECDGECQVRMDIEGLSAGAYFVRVSDGRVSAVRKLIIK